MKTQERITLDPEIKAEILKLYPYLEEEDINQALQYAAWRSEEIELPVQPA